jgi:hypothetical protein
MVCVTSVARVSRREYSCASAPETASVDTAKTSMPRITAETTTSTSVKPAAGPVVLCPFMVASLMAALIAE